MSRIRWIASYPKSGSTWTRLFLIAYQDPDNFNPNERPPNHRHDRYKKPFAAASPVPLDELTVAEAFALRPAALVHQYRKAREATLEPFYLKTHCAKVSTYSTALIPSTLTERALYLVRDPRDVAISYADHHGETIDKTIERMADDNQSLGEGDGAIRQPLLSWSNHVKSWVRDLKFPRMALRYEDLSDNPGRWFSEILTFFQVPLDQDRFDKALALTSFESLQAFEAAHGYGTKSREQERFFRSGKPGAWRGVLTPEQVTRIETDHGEVMKMCGYEIESGA